MTADPHALAAQEHTPMAGFAHDARGGISNPILGMLLFITSEVMFFAGLFAAYFTIRAAYTETIAGAVVHVWPPTEFAHTPTWHVNELRIRSTVAGPTSGRTCNLSTNSTGGQTGAAARTLK